MRDVALDGGYWWEHTACPQKLLHRLKLNEMLYELNSRDCHQQQQNLYSPERAEQCCITTHHSQCYPYVFQGMDSCGHCQMGLSGRSYSCSSTSYSSTGLFLVLQYSEGGSVLSQLFKWQTYPRSHLSIGHFPPYLLLPLINISKMMGKHFVNYRPMFSVSRSLM